MIKSITQDNLAIAAINMDISSFGNNNILIVGFNTKSQNGIIMKQDDKIITRNMHNFENKFVMINQLGIDNDGMFQPLTESLLENCDKLPDLYIQNFMLNIDKINDIQILKVF